MCGVAELTMCMSALHVPGKGTFIIQPHDLKSHKHCKVNCRVYDIEEKILLSMKFGQRKHIHDKLAIC